jgi:hypothetical protein
LILRIENGCIAVEIYLRKIIKSKIKQRRFNPLFKNGPVYDNRKIGGCYNPRLFGTELKMTD